MASAYFKDFHLLLIGVICLATSIEKWNLHKRMALRMVMLVGVNPAWYVLNSILKDNNTCGKLCISEIIAYCFFCSSNLPFLSTQSRYLKGYDWFVGDTLLFYWNPNWKFPAVILLIIRILLNKIPDDFVNKLQVLFLNGG